MDSQYIIDQLSPLERKRYRARKHKWIQKGLPEEEAIRKALGNLLVFPGDKQFVKQGKPRQKLSEQPLVTNGNLYINWLTVAKVAPLFILVCLTTSYLITEAKNFYQASGEALPWICAVAVEAGVLIISIYPSGSLREIRWVFSKILLVLLVLFSYFSVTSKLESESAQKIQSVRVDQLSGDEILQIRELLSAATHAKMSASRYGDHRGIERQDVLIAGYEQQIELLKSAKESDVVIAALQFETWTLRFLRIIFLLLNVGVGHLIGGFLFRKRI